MDFAALLAVAAGVAIHLERVGAVVGAADAVCLQRNKQGRGCVGVESKPQLFKGPF